MDDYYDPEWVPSSAEVLTQAADTLEQFRADARIDPRTSFLLAKWMRSYAAHITAIAREEREEPPVDENALELARRINGETT